MKLFHSKMKSSSVVCDSLRLHGPQTTQAMGFSRPEYCRGQLFPSPGELPNPKTEPRSPALPLAILHQHWHYTKSSSKLEDHLKKGGLDFPPKDQQLYSNCGVELFFLGTTSSYCFSISSRSYCILVRAK